LQTDYTSVHRGHNSVTLKFGVWVTKGHWKWHHLIDHIWIPISIP